MNTNQKTTLPRSFLPSCLLVLVFSLVWIGAGGVDDDTPVEGGEVVIRTPYGTDNLNVAVSIDALTSEVDGYIYETLLTTDPFDLSDIPWLADSLPKASTDHLSYEIRIRKNATFSDGKPVTGKDIIFYLKVIKNTLIQNAAPLRSYYQKIRSVELIDNDPYRIRVNMTEPYFLGSQLVGGLYALPQHILDPKKICDKITFKQLNNSEIENSTIKAFAKWYQKPEFETDKRFLIGSGPYILNSMIPNGDIVLERNPNYWNKEHKYGKAYPNTIVWRTISDENEAIEALKKGTVDVMPIMGKQDFMNAKAEFSVSGIDTAIYDYSSYSYFGFNLEDPLFKDKLVRQALAHVVDRDSIIKNIYYGYARPIQSPIFYKRPECDTSLPIIKYDLNLAKKMLADAGWKDTDNDGILDKVISGRKTNFKFAVLLTSGNPLSLQIANSFSENLKKVGIRAEVLPEDWSVVLTRLSQGEYQMMFGGWAMGGTEGDMRQIWHSSSVFPGGPNRVRFKNAKVDKLIDAISAEFDSRKRLVLEKEIQKIIYDEQPYIFMFSPKHIAAYSKRFRNVQWFTLQPCYNVAWWWQKK